MLRSDWLSYYKDICYSPLVAKSAGFLAAKKDESLALTSESCFVSIFFYQLVGHGLWVKSPFGLQARGIIVKYSVGDRSLRPPRLTLDPEKDACTACSENTALTPFFLANSSNLLPLFFSSCIFIFVPNVSYICICQQRRVYHCMNKCVNNNFPSNAIAPWKLSRGKFWYLTEPFLIRLLWFILF